MYDTEVVIAKTLHVDTENIRVLICGAIIHGAITDPYSKQALEHADRYYGLVRSMNTDVQKIAYNTGFSINDITEVKNHVFMQQHNLGDTVKRFDPSFDIAQSWQRLIENRFIEMDITFIKHELYESQLMKQGKTQAEAHMIASKKYNYAMEVEKYYDDIKKHS